MKQTPLPPASNPSQPSPPENKPLTTAAHCYQHSLHCSARHIFSAHLPAYISSWAPDIRPPQSTTQNCSPFDGPVPRLFDCILPHTTFHVQINLCTSYYSPVTSSSSRVLVPRAIPRLSSPHRTNPIHPLNPIHSSPHVRPLSTPKARPHGAYSTRHTPH